MLFFGSLFSIKPQIALTQEAEKYRASPPVHRTPLLELQERTNGGTLMVHSSTGMNYSSVLR